MQQTYRLYGKLRREMEARWEVLCQAAADAAAKEGTLEPPRSYTIHSGVPVGKWPELQRQVQAGQRPGRLTAEQAAVGKTGHPLEPPAGSRLGKGLCLRAEIPHRARRPRWCRCATAT